MAKDALGLYLVCAEEDNDVLPVPSKLNKISISKNERVVLIEVNMPLFRLSVENISVKKTLTIPKWINDLAEKNKVNFSLVLQNALKDFLMINK